MGELVLQQSELKREIMFIVKGSCELIFEHKNKVPRKQRYLGNHPFKIKELSIGDYMGISCLSKAKLGVDNDILGIEYTKCELSAVVKTSNLEVLVLNPYDLETLPLGIKVNFVLKFH